MSVVTMPKHLPHVYLEPAFHAPNGNIHAGYAELDKFPDNAALKAVHDALCYARSEGESINALRANPHEEDLPATHDRKVRERCEALHSGFGAKYDNAKAGCERELKRVETGITEKANLAPEGCPWSVGECGQRFDCHDCRPEGWDRTRRLETPGATGCGSRCGSPVIKVAGSVRPAPVHCGQWS